MKTFAVYKTENKYKAINVTNRSAREIDNIVGGINWYGCNADTEEKVIQIAIKDGFTG